METQGAQGATSDFWGRVNYEAYVGAVGGVSVRGDDLPTWDEMVERNPKVAAAWIAGADAVCAAAGL